MCKVRVCYGEGRGLLLATKPPSNMKILLQVLGGIAAVIVFAWALNTAIDSSSVAHCESLQRDAHAGYYGFYITRDEARTCAHYHVRVDAPVK